MIVRVFGVSVAITIASLVVAFLYGGWSALMVCAVLAILEISLSFDNAVMNATVLRRMSDFWQKIFLTIGVLIAVFGMRVLFPLVIVWAAAGLAPGEALHLALNPPDPETPDHPSYETILTEAHPQIAALGGMFLLLIFLDYLFDGDRDRWGRFVERALVQLGRLRYAAVIVALAVLLGVGASVDEQIRGNVYLSGMIGMLLYLSIQSLTSLFTGKAAIDGDDADGGRPGTQAVVQVAGKAGFMLFLYLEMLDASFSFDGVIGAFAITSDPILIALGLGFIGAIFVRSLTVYLVRAGTLAQYRYLENGAHWAIGGLAVILLVSIKVEIPEVVSGLVGVFFIGSALVSSVRANRADRRAARAGAGHQVTIESTP